MEYFTGLFVWGPEGCAHLVVGGLCMCSGSSCWRFNVLGILYDFVIKCLRRLWVLSVLVRLDAMLVGPCHQGMARPQVADRGTASDKEGSFE